MNWLCFEGRSPCCVVFAFDMVLSESRIWISDKEVENCTDAFRRLRASMTNEFE